MENINYPSSVENSGTRGSKGVERYVIARDGNGNAVKHLNFENPEVCPREGIIELVPLRVSSRHQNRVSFRNYRDRKNDIICGIPLEVDPETKRWIYEKITLVDAETFDLSIDSHAKRWAVIKNSPYIEGSPNLRDKPIYKVHDRNREAENFLRSRTIKRKAETIAEGLMGEELTNIARNIGIDPAVNSIVTLHAAVIKWAERNPEEFMKIWDSPTRKELTILKRAMSVGVIAHDPMLGINYNGITLGPNEAMAVQFLKDNASICNSIDLISKSKEDESVKAMAAIESPKIKDERDATIEMMRRELEKQNELIKRLAADKLGEELEKAPVVTEVDPELDSLRAEAKDLKIKGAHLMNKETLISKIAETKTIG